MQERPPGSERVIEDPLQLLGAGYKGNLARGAFHGGYKVVGVHHVGRSLIREQLCDLRPRLLHGHPASQRVKCGVLGVRQHGLQRLQVRVGAEQPDEREDLGVYAQLPEVSVVDIGEQPLVVSLGNCLQGRLQLLQSFLVADFQDAQHLVDAEPVTAGVGIRLVVGQDRDKAIRIASLRRQDDAAPETVYRIVRMRSSRLWWSFSRCMPAYVCSANLSMAASTELCTLFSSFAYSARKPFAIARRANAHLPSGARCLYAPFISRSC
jgi:hypothetical protein